MTVTLYQLSPDVAGELGARTIWEQPSPEKPHGPAGVVHVHYEFYHWRGDCLIKASPVYAVTEALAQAMHDSGLTGLSTEEMELSFAEPYSKSGSLLPPSVPRWLRLLPLGNAHGEPRRPKVVAWDKRDLNNGNLGLVVTEKALSIIQQHGLPNCIIRPLTFET